MKFRILKEVSFGNRITYKIQRKVLFFFWIDHGITTMYSEYDDWNARGTPTHLAFLTKRIFNFYSEEEARKYLHKIQNPISEDYKGDKIIRVFRDHTWEDVFINKSFYGYKFDKFGYEYANSIEEIKASIDKRKFKPQKTAILSTKIKDRGQDN